MSERARSLTVGTETKGLIELMKDTNQSRESTHDVQHWRLPCCETEVRLRVPYEQAIHLYERTCKKCGRLWTFATDRRRYGGDGWGTGTSIKIGRPTVPAVEEVLLNRDEDGWRDAHNRQEMLKLAQQVNARQL